MSKYYYGFELSENTKQTESQVKEKLRILLKQKELDDQVFDQASNNADVIVKNEFDKIWVEDIFTDISTLIPGALLYLDVYTDENEIYRMYAQNGERQYIDATISFKKPSKSPADWVS